MVGLARVVVIGVVLFAVAGWIERPVVHAPDAPGDAGLATSQETIVTGAAPDLVGRWLAVITIELKVQKRMLTAVLDVSSGDAGLQVNERFVALPSALKAEIDDASAKGVAWEATPDDLEAVAAAWDTLAREERFVDRARHELIGKDAFDATIMKEPRFTGARWMLRQEYGFVAGASRPMRQVTFYSPTVEEPWGHAGAYVTVMVAAAPFPVPITFEGHFKLYRLPTAKPRRGWFG